MGEDSSRTKMLKEAKAEGPVGKAVKYVSTKASELADKFGFTQEEQYKGKTPEELATKKAKGGTVKSASSRADGIAKKGKTRGRIV